jgi:hypothetical protein
MDKWEDYSIKVLDMAPLNMVTLSTVSSLFSTCGCFLRVGRSSSGDLPPLSLACGWPLVVNGSLCCEWWRLHELRVEDPSDARKGGRNQPWDWARPVQDGGSPCMKSGLLHFNPRGCSFVALRPLPSLEVISSRSWTQTRLRDCSFELVVNPSFMSMFPYINITLPNACTKMNLLYD